MRPTHILLAAAAVFAVAGCRTASVQSGSTAAAAPPAIAAGSSELPAGTSLQVTLNDALSTDQSKQGDEVRATVTTPVKDSSGQTLVPTGTTVVGEVTGVAASPHAGEPAAIRVDFNRLELAGGETSISSEITDTQPEVNQNYGRAGKGAAIGGGSGAILGAVLGGSLKGAVIGGLLGAGAGTAISLGTGDVQAALPAGTPMTLELTAPVSVR